MTAHITLAAFLAIAIPAAALGYLFALYLMWRGEERED